MRVVLVLAGVVAASMALSVLPQKALAPANDEVLHGWLCHTCREIFSDAENIGTAYNMAWLDSAIDMRCKALAVISHDCKKHFNNDKATIDQKIQQKEKPDYACVDIGYCA